MPPAPISNPTRRRRAFGPAAVVAAAFIGPGTVTTATLAGAAYGYTLLWGITFSTLATIALQEMSMRLGVVGRVSLGEAIRLRVPTGLPFAAAAALVVAAVLVGNAAYEGGNLAGALVGVRALPGLGALPAWTILAPAGLAALLLATGRTSLLQNALAALVLVMSVVFVVAALASRPPAGALLAGMFVPRLPSGAELAVIGLIGTTVVPYNLFLHASVARAHYPSADDLAAARLDTYVSVAIGGLVTLAIAVAAAGAGLTGEPDAARQLAAPLRNTFGAAGDYLIAGGFFAAGLSSAVTAPLAAAFAVGGLLRWDARLRSARMVAIWAGVLLVGAGFAATSTRPVRLILLAQVANGLLLPIIAAFLLWVANDATLLGTRRNSTAQNLAGALVLAVAVGLGARSLYFAFS